MIDILVFKIGATSFGIESVCIKSINKGPGYRDEHRSASEDGVVEYGGRKLAVIDIKKRFFPDTDGALRDREVGHIAGLSGERDGKYREVKHIIVSPDGDEFVIVVDEVVDIHCLSMQDVKAIPPFALKYMPDNLFKGAFGVKDELVLMLDVSKLL